MHTAPGFLHVFRPPPVIFVAGAINGENGRDDPKWFCQARCTAMLTQYTRSTRRVPTEYTILPMWFCQDGLYYLA